MSFRYIAGMEESRTLLKAVAEGRIDDPARGIAIIADAIQDFVKMNRKRNAELSARFEDLYARFRASKPLE